MSSAATIAIPPASMPVPIPALSLTYRDLDLRTTSNATPVVFVVDDDIDIRESLELLIRSQGWQPQTCGSVGELLSLPRSGVPNALILAFSFADSNRLETQKKIAKDYADMPIIIITDFGDIPTTVGAMKAGAVDFLVKPYRDSEILRAVREALTQSRQVLAKEREKQIIRKCYASLSPRERQVMALVSAGLMNKQVGAELGISEITVKAHRGQVMQKMTANSLADLVKMAARLGLSRNNEFLRLRRDDSGPALSGMPFVTHREGILETGFPRHAGVSLCRVAS